MPTQIALRFVNHEELMHWYFEVLQKYTLFTGRARRSEFWNFVLISVLIGFVLGILDAMIRKFTGFGPLGIIYGLAVLVPGIAVSVRRLHDTDRSGWWLLLGLVPLVGFVLIVFLIEDSKTSTNRYGQNPKFVIA